MKPIHQTLFGMPDGNCIAACVASILELEGVELPSLARENDWLEALNRWLRQLGQPWRAVCFYPSPAQLHYTMLPGVLLCAGGKGPRGHGHMVVWRDGAVVHDPHPEGGGLVGPVEDVLVLFPLDAGETAQLRRAHTNCKTSFAELQGQLDACLEALDGLDTAARVLAGHEHP